MLLTDVSNGKMSPLKRAFLADRLLRCSLLQNPNHAQAWGFLAFAVAQRQTQSKHPTLHLMELAVQLAAYALHLSPTDPLLLHLARQQLAKFAPRWAAAGSSVRRFESHAANLHHRLLAGYQSAHASEWYSRGYLFEMQGNKSAAQRSFLKAWEIDPDNEQFMTTAFVVITTTQNASMIAAFRRDFAQNESIPNYRAWKALHNGRESSVRQQQQQQQQQQPNPENESQTFNMQRDLHGLVGSTEADLEATLLTLSGVRATVRGLATPSVCNKVRELVGVSQQRVSLMYQLPSMEDVVLVLNRHSASEERSRGAFNASWSFRIANPRQEQHFPVYLANMLLSVCTESANGTEPPLRQTQGQRLRMLTHWMDVVGIHELQPSVSSLNEQDAFGNTAAHIAAGQVDLVTLAELLRLGADSTDLRNTWGHSVSDLLSLAQPQLKIKAVDSHTGQPTNEILREAPATQKCALFAGPRGWMPDSETFPWGPLAEWNDRSEIQVVDAKAVSLADVITKFVSVGRPVVIRNILAGTMGEPECREAIRRQDDDSNVDGLGKLDEWLGSKGAHCNFKVTVLSCYDVL